MLGLANVNKIQLTSPKTTVAVVVVVIVVVVVVAAVVDDDEVVVVVVVVVFVVDVDVVISIVAERINDLNFHLFNKIVI